MYFRVAAAMFAVCLAAAAQSLSVDQLSSFIQSSIQLKQSDREVASFLSKVKLTERLDDRQIETFQAMGIGPKTLQALHELRDASQGLGVARPVVEPPKPRPIPPPSSEEQAAYIEEARDYALNYSRTLPDFICTQVTRRYAAGVPGTRYGGTRGGDPSWHLMDTLTIRLSYFEQKEDYKLVLVNNTVTNADYHQLGGATSTGEFGTLLRDIFERSSQARLEWDHWATLRGRRALAFAYRVAQPNSQWHIQYEHELDIVPAYRGLIYIDKDTHRILRVTLAADDIPAGFPVKSAETVLDYDFQDISGQKFLLPLKAETRLATADILNRNDVEFRLYRKFSTETEIKYDTPEPLDENQTKEQPIK
jgi:hypothetical protein